MAAVFTQMRRDAIGSRGSGGLCRPHRIWMIATSRITDGRDMVDVDAEA
jgi:hypothetical protein